MQNVNCTTSVPSVTIITPTDGTGSDVAKHVLAASATGASQLKDSDLNVGGAQFTVKACTDAPVGSAMQLTAGLKGSTLAPLASATAVANDGSCPAGEPNVGIFANAKLPESAESITGALVTATELVVKVTDVATTGTSQAVDVGSIRRRRRWSPPTPIHSAARCYRAQRRLPKTCDSSRARHRST